MTSMPILKESKVFTVQSLEAGEDLLDQRGFGAQEPTVRMMNLMMVEGSGYEGMDMSGMKMASHDEAKPTLQPADSTKSEANRLQKLVLKKFPAVAKVGPNIYEFALSGQDGMDLKGLKLKAQVYMTSMDMGTDTPRVREIKPGLYETKVTFSMAGPWALKILSPAGESTLKISVVK